MQVRSAGGWDRREEAWPARVGHRQPSLRSAAHKGFRGAERISRACLGAHGCSRRLRAGGRCCASCEAVRLDSAAAVVKQAAHVRSGGLVVCDALRVVACVGASAHQRPHRLHARQRAMRCVQDVVHGRVLQVLGRQLCGRNRQRRGLHCESPRQQALELEHSRHWASRGAPLPPPSAHQTGSARSPVTSRKRSVAASHVRFWRSSGPMGCGSCASACSTCCENSSGVLQERVGRG